MNDTQPPKIAPKLLRWYQRHGRHDLPWKQGARPYYIWLSEIMLQQTQVATVIPYFEKFIRHFPDIKDLAAADSDTVMHLWAGLGYYARARNLHQTARRIMDEHHGHFPQTLEALQALPGIGRSTAGAILAQAFDQPQAILDGNVKRVLSRYHTIPGWPGETRVSRQLWRWAEYHTPTNRVADYTQAIMDLGATVCRRQPLCDQCPLQGQCRAAQRGEAQDYPHKRPKKTRPRKTRQFLLLLDEAGRVLLQKRPPNGIWGGLWSLPELESDKRAPAWCRRELGLEVERIQLALPPLEHSFSHFTLLIKPVCLRTTGQAAQIMEPSETLWYNSKQPQTLGLPAPVETLLTTLARRTGQTNQGESNEPNGTVRQAG